MKAPGDRRKGARSVPVRIVDASALGVLIASPIRFSADSIQELCINVGDHEFRIDARVCHVRSGDPGYAKQDSDWSGVSASHLRSDAITDGSCVQKIC
jgi:hypothetical protein